MAFASLCSPEVLHQGSLNYLGRQGRRGPDDREGVTTVLRAGEEGTQVPVTPLSWALLSGQLGPSPTAPSPLTSRPKPLPRLLFVPDRVARHQQTSRDISHQAAAAGARAKLLQGLFEAQQRIEQTLCPGSLPVRKGKETHEKRSKEESKVLGSGPVPGAMNGGPGGQGRLSGSLPWADSPAWPSSSPPAAAGRP